MEDSLDTGMNSRGETTVHDPLELLDGNSNMSASLAPLRNANADYKHLTEEEQKDMSTSIADVFKLEEDARGGTAMDMDDDAEELVDVEDRKRRTERLKGALGKFAHLWWQDSIFINEAVEKLADGSRDGELFF